MLSPVHADRADATGRLVPPDGAWPIEAGDDELYVALYDLLADPGETANLAADNPAIVGRTFFAQGLVLDPPANPLGVTASNGGAITAGAR